MTRQGIYLLGLLALSVFFLTPWRLRAQLPTCNTPGLVYFHVGSNIYNYDPYQPVGGGNPAVNTISAPGTGLAISNNLNAPGPSPTFYTVSGGTFWYYDGTAWINTGHANGNPGAVNITGGGPYIYALVGGTGEVYQYDGTGTAILLTTVTGFNGGGPFDLVADIFGNWYILKMTAAGGGPYLRKYSPTGTLIQSWSITGSPGSSSGGGFAIICDSIYVQSGSGYYKGYVGATSINLVPATNPVSAGTPGDMASCPAGTGAGSASIDTAYYCGSGPGIPVTVSGNGAISWTVLSGNAVVSASGFSATITATVTSRILVTISGGQGICSSGTDTITLIVPTASISMIPAVDTIAGCSSFLDTLHAQIGNMSPGLNYTYTWAPAASIISGGNTPDPVVNPSVNTTYILTVATPPHQGGCSWTDSVRTVLKNQSVQADFSYTVKYGCQQDTVLFQNLGTSGVLYEWKFGNNAGDTLENPVYVYPVQGQYTVRLLVRNGICTDTISKLIDTRHTLEAAFTSSRDTLCAGQSVSFTNTSTVASALGPARYYWDFKDGVAGDTTEDVTHLFANPGVYTVMLVVTDGLGCRDTAFRTVVVDSLVAVAFSLSDTSVCEGRHIMFTALTTAAYKGLEWDFGDGTRAREQISLLHAYDSSGVYTVTLTGNSRTCPDINVSRQVEIKPYPEVDLGPDTSICTNGDPLLLRDYKNAGNPAVAWLWNTGERKAMIVVKNPGLYTVSADLNGCVTNDSVAVRKDCYVNIPNAFSPNGDGINDYFLPRPLNGIGLTEFRMIIFNRWGQEIFRTEKLEGRGWDGRFNGVEQPAGVYIYMIDLVLKNQAVEHYHGNVTLIR